MGVVVTTSSLRGRGPLRSLELADLPAFLAGASPSPRVAFVFGPERSGLTDDEISRASVLLRLPSDPAFPTLNLSHAVAVVLAVARGFEAALPKPEPSEEWAPSAEVEAAIAHWDRALEAIDFYDTGHPERSLRDWRKIIAGRPLASRDVAILRGVANRILVALEVNRKS
jgi:tRNA C32,U32 (ribose-2'-O)-methylase TrmJ